MASFVFYKFKSALEMSKISFDGVAISVFDLKKEIIHQNKMGKPSDFDFRIYNTDTDAEYTDDRALIQRSTAVLARRLPPSKPNRGTAQLYVPTTVVPLTRTDNRDKTYFSRRFDQDQPAPPDNVPAESTGDEASAMAAMFAATSQQWQQTQEQMASATPIHRAPMARPARPAPPRDGPTLSGPHSGSSNHASGSHERTPFVQIKAGESTKPPPVGYICYRCGSKGHWIQDCPTNNDRAWDDRPRIKRTTGIPKSFLTTVEAPTGGDNTPAGMMVTAEGGFVIARPDSASWLAHRALTKNLSAKDIQNLAPMDPDLTCPICSKLLREATLAPCCSTSFCEECLHNILLDNDFLCPECESRIKNLGKLVVDSGRRERAKLYIDEMVEASREEVVEEEALTLEVVKAEGEEDVTVAVPVGEGDAAATAGATPIEVEPVVPKVSTDDAASAAPTSEAQSTVTPTVVPVQPPQQSRPQQQQQKHQSRPVFTPLQLQQHIYQLNLSLQNPQLHPQMRMQCQMQLQQAQMTAVQMGLVPGAVGGHRMGGAISAAYGGHMANRGAGASQGGTNRGGPIPTGPRAESQSTEGAKRARPDDFVEAPTGEKVPKAE